MNRLRWKCLLIGAVALVALSSAASQADAHWWGWSRTWGCCYTPCYTSCYTPCYTTVSCDPCCYTGSWYLGWRPGPVRRLVFGSYRWYWGGYWDSCCTTYTPCCDSSVPAATVTPATPAQPTPAPAKPAAPSATMPTEPAAPSSSTPMSPNTTSVTPAETSGILTVWVPYDARVTVNGLETKSTGSRRQFVSYGLKPGFSYKYVVHAVIVRDGQTQEDTRTVVLTAGKIAAVAFGFNASAVEQIASR